MGEKKHTSEQVIQDDSQKIIERLTPPTEDTDDIDPKKTKKRKGVLYKKRTHEPNEDSLNLEIPRQKTVEETWEQSEDDIQTFTKGKSNNILSIITAFTGIILGCGVWSIYHILNDTKSNLAEVKEPLEKNMSEKLSLKSEIIIASDVVEHYLKASTVSEKSKYIYKAKLFKNEIESYYRDNQGLKSTPDFSIKGVLPITLNGEEILEVVIKYKMPIIEQFRTYYVRKDAAGDYKVDWKADVVFQDNSIKKFQLSRAKEATAFKFEVKNMSALKAYNWGFKNPDYTVLALDTPFSEKTFWGLQLRYEFSPFNWGFSDKDYNVFRLDIPNSPLVFWGYVKKRSHMERELLNSIEQDTKIRIFNHDIKHEFILKVRFLKDSPIENKQYIFIEDIVSSKWVNTDE